MDLFKFAPSPSPLHSPRTHSDSSSSSSLIFHREFFSNRTNDFQRFDQKRQASATDTFNEVALARVQVGAIYSYRLTTLFKRRSLGSGSGDSSSSSRSSSISQCVQKARTFPEWAPPVNSKTLFDSPVSVHPRI